MCRLFSAITVLARNHTTALHSCKRRIPRRAHNTPVLTTASSHIFLGQVQELVGATISYLTWERKTNQLLLLPSGCLLHVSSSPCLRPRVYSFLPGSLLDRPSSGSSSPICSSPSSWTPRRWLAKTCFPTSSRSSCRCLFVLSRMSRSSCKGVYTYHYTYICT